ncbi:DUF1266 domain-containing protein [Streptomyces triticirhizae]|uniref:DUF1266 domain-containing protein n=1 Tax=Streptomyces triticirhizae TaxID=2483353 RepID=A0A3M2KY58_9ACTN|nr:DUF1266 domain-containing protein [Streptomyces triticirhizae]RMI30004.1 DUF1266 domain-containing protein [Streptomyces triticirhizae]
MGIEGKPPEGAAGDAGEQPGVRGAEETAWQPPTTVEERLYAAGLHADWPTYFEVLAGTDLFLPTSRELADAVPGRLRFSPFHHPDVEGLCLPVFTRGMLPPPVDDRVFERCSLAALAKRWPRPARWLAVNPGTPVETLLPADPRGWKRQARHGAEERPLKTLWTGHRSGPLAHGLACGSLLLVNNGTLWNQLGWQSGGYTEEKELLRAWWGVTTRAQWLAVLQRLLTGQVISPAWEFVLWVRQLMVQRSGSPPDPVAWREGAERMLLARTAEEVDRTGRPPEYDLDADIGLAHELIGRVLRYEARFRADGLLTDDGCVRSVLAWDLGRASCLARWGLGAGFATLAETERAVLRSGEGARQIYDSWGEFAAGYVLGRCLHFDSEEFGDWYTEMVEVFRVLTTDPESPWLSVPWEQPAVDLTDR